MQGRVDQPHRHRQAVHRGEDADEVLALQGKQGRQCRLPLVVALRQDQALDVLAPVTQEHVLGPAQPDAFGAEPARPLGVLRRVGVCADGHAAYGICVIHQPVDRGDEITSILGVGVELTLEVLDDR